MEKVFDYMRRSSDLIAEGIPLEEMVEILGREEDEAEWSILDDGALVSALQDVREECLRELEEID